MKILILAANGRLGNLITDEAIKQSLDVTILVQQIDDKVKSKNVPIIEKDINDLTSNDIKDFDVIISAYGEWRNEFLDNHIKINKHLVDIVKSYQNKRLIIVGGAASLYLDESKSKQVIQLEDFPEVFLPLAKAQFKVWENLVKEKDVKWTMFSPAMNFDFEGPSTNNFQIGTDFVINNNKNNSYLSYKDAAKVIINEIKNQDFIKKRFTAITNQ